MIIPGFTLRHTRTVPSCASSSVKSHVSSNKATPRVVPTLLKPFRDVERLCHLFSRFHLVSRHESMGRNLVFRPLSGFINQLETKLLVHALQLPLHLERHGVSLSPMGTMFASAPSKLPRSTCRTSHQSGLSPEMYCTSSIPGRGSAAAWPASPCSRVCMDTRGVRSRPVASTVRLFSFEFGSRATVVRGMRCHRFPHISHRSWHIAALRPF